MSKHIAILGAGPVGIEAALYARSLGLSVTLYDRGAVASNVADWGHVHLFTPWRMNVTPLGVETLRRAKRWPEFPADVCPSGRELRGHYLVPLTESELLRAALKAETTVLRIGRDHPARGDAAESPARPRGAFRLLVEDAAGSQRVDRADVVIDCTGTYGHHRWAGRAGIPAVGEMSLEDQIFYTLPDPAGRDRHQFVDRHTLLLGCGYSAATFLKDVELLNRSHPVTKVTWAIRRPGLALRAIQGDPLPARRHLVEASLRLAEDPPHWLAFLGSVAMESIDFAGGTFTTELTEVERPGRDPHVTVRSDAVVALVGYSPDAGVYDQLDVSARLVSGGPMGVVPPLGAGVNPETLKNPEPDFYVLGAKSYGTNSNFLMQVGHEQVRSVFRLIAGNSWVDLYPPHAYS